MEQRLNRMKDEAARLLQGQSYIEAVAAYSKILCDNPNDVTARLRLGEIFTRLERTEDAVRSYEHVARQYAQEGLVLKSMNLCKKILELDERHNDTKTLLLQLEQARQARARTQESTPPQNTTEKRDRFAGQITDLIERTRKALRHRAELIADFGRAKAVRGKVLWRCAFTPTRRLYLFTGSRIRSLSLRLSSFSGWNWSDDADEDTWPWEAWRRDE